MTKTRDYFVMLIGFAILAFLLILAFQLDGRKNLPGKNEIDQIKASSKIDDQVKLYRKLIERVGPLEAQEELLKSGLPFTGETHLLNHTAGDYIYVKYGPAGLQYCKEYFLASCYHGFILHAIGDGGMNAVEKTFEGCLKDSPTVYVQCAHAIGHGFLANLGYKNLTDALNSCDKVAKDNLKFPSFNCYDGVFMENIWAVHDGNPSPDRWVNASDLFYPCNDNRIDKKYILACWSNQPSLAYQLLKGDIKKVADNVCSFVSDDKLQKMCFEGLSRQIHPIANGSPKKTFMLCSLLPGKWQDFCISVNASASYAVGDRGVSFEVCAHIDENGKGECYNRLFSTIKAYSKDKNEMKTMCSKVLENDWQKKCLDQAR